jgi:hypothetical protein
MKRHILGATCILSLSLSAGCTQHSVNSGSYSAPSLSRSSRYEELRTPVPSNFSDADKWNQKENCPDEAVLSPLTRYTFEPGQKNRGFKFYYGRSCEIVQTPDADDEIPNRKIASIDNANNFSVTLIPHGAFMYWYEDGRRMQLGSFDHGSLATDWHQYEPDGSMATQE